MDSSLRVQLFEPIILSAAQSLGGIRYTRRVIVHFGFVLQSRIAVLVSLPSKLHQMRFGYTMPKGAM